MGGHPVPNEDLVNLPEPGSRSSFRLEGEEPIRGWRAWSSCPTGTSTTSATRSPCAGLRFRDRAGRETTLASRRFVSMDRMHQAALAWDLVAENWSGHVELVSAHRRTGAQPRRGPLPPARGRHLDPQAPRIYAPRRHRAEGAHPPVADRDRRGGAHAGVRAGHEVAVDRHTFQTEDYIQQVLASTSSEGEPVRVEKMVALYTSRDRAISEPLLNAGAARPATRRSTRRSRGTRARLGGAVGRMRHPRPARAARAVPAAPAHLAPAAGLLAD